MNLRKMLTPLLTVSATVCLCGVVGAQDAKPAAIEIDAAKKTILIPCRIAPRKLEKAPDPNNPGVIYPLEVVATWPAPKGLKAHETVVVFDVKPSDVHKALESFGLKPGKPAMGEGVGSGPELKVSLEIPGNNGQPKRIAMEKAMVDGKTGKPMPKLKWFFTGSTMKKPDPNKPEQVYGADLSGTLIAIFPVTDETVIQTSLTMKEAPLLKLETDKTALPKEGMDVKLVLEVK